MSDTEKGILFVGGAALLIFLWTRHDSVRIPTGNLYPSYQQQYNQDQVAMNAAANAASFFVPNQQMISSIFGSSFGASANGVSF